MDYEVHICCVHIAIRKGPQKLQNKKNGSKGRYPFGKPELIKLKVPMIYVLEVEEDRQISI